MLLAKPAHRFVLGATLCVASGLGLACGDGEAEPPPPWLPITADNAATVASTVWLDNASSDVDDVMPEAFELLDDFLPLVALQPAGDRIDVPCAVSGVVYVSGQVADEASPGWTAGDHVTATFEACVREPGEYGEQLDGEAGLTILSAGGTEQALELTYADLTLTVPSLGALRSNGSSTMTLSREEGVQTLEVSTTELTTVGPGFTEIARDHSVRLIDRGDTFELSFGATMISGRLGGAVRFETVVPFAGPSGGPPDAGELVVTGAGESAVRLIALGGEDVRLEIDGDGDGVVDPGGTVATTWWDLEATP